MYYIYMILYVDNMIVNYNVDHPGYKLLCQPI